MPGGLRSAPLAALLGVFAWSAAVPAVAHAHGGPNVPVASSYLARVGSEPPGLQAQVVDGDLRLWLQAPPHLRVIVLDYRGAPYLRFTGAGVDVNESSVMYYLNQTPVPATPPASLGPQTPPRWQRASGGHSYVWHDGRLHAFATVALSPGSSYVGRWRVPLLVDGRPSSVAGGLWHAAAPSIVWFWPIAVLLLCVLAAVRVQSPELDRRTARVLAVLALSALLTGEAGRGLHGRPTISVFQLIELGLVLAFSAWSLARVLSGRAGSFLYAVIATVAVWEGVQAAPTLVDGFVLMALPAFVARAAAVVALGTGFGLGLVAFRLAQAREQARPSRNRAAAREDRAHRIA